MEPKMVKRYRLDKMSGAISVVEVFKESITTVEFYSVNGGKRLENKDTKDHKWFKDPAELATYAMKHFSEAIKEAEKELLRLKKALDDTQKFQESK